MRLPSGLHGFALVSGPTTEVLEYFDGDERDRLRKDYGACCVDPSQPRIAVSVLQFDARSLNGLVFGRVPILADIDQRDYHKDLGQQLSKYTCRGNTLTDSDSAMAREAYATDPSDDPKTCEAIARGSGVVIPEIAANSNDGFHVPRSCSGRCRPPVANAKSRGKSMDHHMELWAKCLCPAFRPARPGRRVRKLGSSGRDQSILLVREARKVRGQEQDLSLYRLN